MTDSIHRKTVFIVDDDASVRDSLGLLLSLRGYATAVFASAEDFLQVLKPHWSGCVLVDLRMPGMSGLELQAALGKISSKLPVIVVTGHGNVDAARRAFKARAVDFLEKPLDDLRLTEAIEAALARPTSREDGAPRPEPPGVASLTAREREVIALVIDGADNRGVAQRLGISPRTVEVHKARVMLKLGARNMADLMRLHHRFDGLA